MQAQQLAQLVDGELYGNDVEVNNVSIDTRTLQAGDSYIAIIGEYHDGHKFIPQAIAAGAVCVITQHSLTEEIPYILVKDTLLAFQQIAAYHRQQMNVKTIAVTGSCGKTTTRALLASIFSQAGPTHASKGSFNNHLGVPLTLLELKPEHRYFVAEIGANHMGEIAALVPLVQPDVSIITNVGEAHLEGFGSLANTAAAKGEIFAALKPEGTAVINMDDNFAQYWLQMNKHHQIMSFGIKHEADVMADNIQLNEYGCAQFTLVLPQSVIDVQLNLFGEHNVSNALAAAAAGCALGLTPSQIKAGLESAAAEQRRLIERKTALGATVIDDSYNANPLSTEAAIKLLVHRAAEPILVFADMKEMGEDEQEIHARLGLTAKSLGVSQLYCYGDLAKQTAEAFGDGAFHFTDKNALIERLQQNLTPQQTLLVKGSNSMKMNEVVEALIGAAE